MTRVEEVLAFEHSESMCQEILKQEWLMTMMTNECFYISKLFIVVYPSFPGNFGWCSCKKMACLEVKHPMDLLEMKVVL